MFKRGTHFLAAALLPAIGMLAGCAGKSAPAPVPTEAASPTGTAVNELASIAVEDRGGINTIIINGSQPMSPNIFKLMDPPRIIVDLTDTKLGAVQGPIAVNRGGVSEITVTQFDDAASSLSRVVIGLEEPLEYQVATEGNVLTLAVSKTGEMPTTETTGLPVVPAEAAAAAEPAAMPLEPIAEASAGAEGAAAVAAPADAPPTAATQLTDIQYSSGESGTTVRLIADGAIDTFEDMILESPRRLVIDLKGLKNGYPGTRSLELGTAEIGKLRLGKDSDKVRVVLDLAGDAKPAYTIDREASALVVNVATAIAAAPSPEEPAPMAAAAPMEAPSAEPAVAPVAIASATSQPVMVTGLSFRQLPEQNRSRITIGLSEPTADYAVRDLGPGSFVLEIFNSKIDKPILKREFNTAEFHTAVLSIMPKIDSKAHVTRFTVELEQQVPYRVNAEGNELHVDVDIPAQVARKQTESVTQKKNDIPTPPPAEEGESENGALGSESGEKPELLLESPKPVAAAAAQKDYRYVKEGFMSDSTATGEPLSNMGAILAGEYRGRRFTGRRISLDFKDADIRSIFRLIADISKLNIIISDDVSGRVTVRLESVPWDQAFAIILQTKGLWFEKYGNIVRIAPAEKLRAEKELAAAAERAAKAAKPLDVLFKPVSYATAGELIKQVRSVLSDRGTVDIDSRTNTLIIKDIRENLEKAKKMVEILDTQTPQVSIEARIVEATTAFTRSFGIIWGGRANFSPSTGNPTGLFFPNSVGVQGQSGAGNSFGGLPIALNFPSPFGANMGTGIKLGSINGILDLDLAIGFLETQGQAKLVSSPKITVLDNESATINAGSKIPFITQTPNAGSNVRFESATTSLAVQPHITNEGSVLMTISATRNEPNFAQLVEGNPLIDQRTANTKVLVKSGNTTVLGGVYSIRANKVSDGVPGLSKIPILGWLFKSQGRELKRTELLIFVTPRIVGDEREAVRDIRS